jgi:hypothetical protein
MSVLDTRSPNERKKMTYNTRNVTITKTVTTNYMIDMDALLCDLIFVTIHDAEWFNVIPSRSDLTRLEKYADSFDEDGDLHIPGRHTHLDDGFDLTIWHYDANLSNPGMFNNSFCKGI